MYFYLAFVHFTTVDLLVCLCSFGQASSKLTLLQSTSEEKIEKIDYFVTPRGEC